MQMYAAYVSPPEEVVGRLTAGGNAVYINIDELKYRTVLMTSFQSYIFWLIDTFQGTRTITAPYKIMFLGLELTWILFSGTRTSWMKTMIGFFRSLDQVILTVYCVLQASFLDHDDYYVFIPLNNLRCNLKIQAKFILMHNNVLLTS